MNNKSDLKQQANNLRKSGYFTEALKIYRVLWEESSDKFDGAGLLHCLRKLKLFSEAIPLADELFIKHKDFNWCRIEITWTYIEGLVEQFEENEPFESVLQVSNKILSLEPEDLVVSKIVFLTIKHAKKANKWDTVDEWTAKIDPRNLSKDPIVGFNHDGWSYYWLWHYYKVKALIMIGETSLAIDLLDELSPETPRGQQKFFSRLKALAYLNTGQYFKAEDIYSKLCSQPKVDWWLLHEYAKVLKGKGELPNALSLMYRAALSNSRLESMVTLFLDISSICKELGNLIDSRNHLYLTLYIRGKMGWKIGDELLSRINSLDIDIGDGNKPETLYEAQKVCRATWKYNVNETGNTSVNFLPKNNIRTNLVGKVRIGQNEKPFCFIYLPDNESIFCYKSNLPISIKDNDIVMFDSIPSFDKKKNIDSCKAANVRLQDPT